MSYIQPNNLSLFQPPPMDDTVEKQQYVSHKPLAPIQDGQNINFIITNSGAGYINLQKSLLTVEMKIVKGSGEPTTAVQKVTTSNLTLHSLFRQVDVSLQQQNVTSGLNSLYPYRAVLDVLLNGATIAELRREMFYKDTPGKLERTAPTAAYEVMGLHQRFARTTAYKTIILQGGLRVGIMQQPRLLLNHVELQIQLIPSSLAFRLLREDDGPFKIAISDVSFHTHVTHLRPELYLAHEKALTKAPALYPYQREYMKSLNIPAGVTDFNADNQFPNQTPTSLVLAVVASDAFAGDEKKNYSNFEHFKANRVEVTLDNNHVFNSPQTQNFTAAQFTHSYLSAYGNRQAETKYATVHLEDYASGYTIFKFDLKKTSGENIFVKVCRSDCS